MCVCVCVRHRYKNEKEFCLKVGSSVSFHFISTKCPNMGGNFAVAINTQVVTVVK